MKMETLSGRRFDPLDPDPDSVDLSDIGWALSMMCRFNGHVVRFYSVAEHSVRVAQHVQSTTGSEECAGQALLHDAAEGYIADLVTPVKRRMAEYKEIEDRLLAAILKRYGYPPKLAEAVLLADRRLLLTEARDLKRVTDFSDWPAGEPLSEYITETWSQFEAYKRFMDMAHRLGVDDGPRYTRST